jgi:tRNA 2-thiouridine synthesizing protein A
VTHHIDARGLKCPQPVIELSRAVSEVRPTQISIDVDDPAARVDIPAWCRMRRHEHVSMTEHSTHQTHIIKINMN